MNICWEFYLQRNYENDFLVTCNQLVIVAFLLKIQEWILQMSELKIMYKIVLIKAIILEFTKELLDT